MSTEPDWIKLKSISAEVERLQLQGAWTRDEFERLHADAVTASNGHGEFTEAVLNEADPSWL